VEIKLTHYRFSGNGQFECIDCGLAQQAAEEPQLFEARLQPCPNRKQKPICL
jgi:hypothetical protein